MEKPKPQPVEYGRSREGAWIEIGSQYSAQHYHFVAPARERGLKYGCASGKSSLWMVAPARERGLKLMILDSNVEVIEVAPARERGLKYKYCRPCKSSKWSLPRGSVD